MSARAPWAAVGGVNGCVAVLAGAYGWHSLAADEGGRLVFMMAVQYQMWHALALLGVAWLARARPSLAAHLAGALFTAGIVLFAGGLYWYGLFGDVPVRGAAPAGGLLLAAGWLALAWAALGRR